MYPSLLPPSTSPWPPATSPSTVVLLSAEDALADTVRPRLEAAGADLDHVVALPYLPPGGERPLRLPVDIPLLAQLVRQLQARLLVVDPLLAFLSLRASVGNDQSIRAALAPLALLAERLECAVVLVRHLTKHTSRNSLYRGSGSIGLIGLARAGLLVAPDPDDPAGARRVLASTKSNLGPTAPSLAYRLVAAPTGATAIAWDGPVHHSAASLFAPPTDQREATVLGEAMAVLAAILADGPVDAALVQRQAAQAGLSASALRRARATLGVRSRRVSPPGQAGPGWVWELPFHPPAPH